MPARWSFDSEGAERAEIIEHILWVKSNLLGLRDPSSLSQGSGMAATHNPTMAATNNRVASGNRRMYERSRSGLNCGRDGMAGDRKEHEKKGKKVGRDLTCAGARMSGSEVFGRNADVQGTGNIEHGGQRHASTHPRLGAARAEWRC